MKMNAKTACLLVITCAMAGLWRPEQVRAQNSSVRTEAVEKAIQSMQQVQGIQKPAVRQNSPHPDDLFSAGPRKPSYRSGSAAIRKAAEALRDAKGEDAKAEAEKKLADLLSKSYDEDMAQREQELKQIEQRLTKLRELLSRRRSKKQEIIDLQIKVALNEADGLSFYDHEASSKITPNPYFYYSVPRPAEPIPPSPVAPPASAAPPATAPRAKAPTKAFGAEPFVDPAPSSDSEPSTPTPSR